MLRPSKAFWPLLYLCATKPVSFAYTVSTLDDFPPPVQTPTPTATAANRLHGVERNNRRDDQTTLASDLSTTAVQPLSTITVWVTEYNTASDSATATTTADLTSTSAVTVAETIGLIMPDPWSSLYTDLNYTFGFVDVIPRPAPTYGSWIRQIQPLLIFPDETVNVFPSSGTDDPTSSEAVPVGSDGLCGATVEDYAISYPFLFTEPGWYMFVINQTYMQANVTEHYQCALPLIQEKSFFATQTLSIAARPTWTPGPASPVDPYTVFASVSTSVPSTMPYDPQPTTSKEKLGIALGVTGGVIGLASIIATMWWVGKKRQMNAEALAFSRLPAKDQEAFLRDNPGSFLNPNRPQRGRGKAYGAYEQGPPAPPGSMAYALWYSQQMWNRQVPSRRQPSNWGNYAPAPTTMQQVQQVPQTQIPVGYAGVGGMGQGDVRVYPTTGPGQGSGQPVSYNQWR